MPGVYYLALSVHVKAISGQMFFICSFMEMQCHACTRKMNQNIFYLYTVWCVGGNAWGWSRRVEWILGTLMLLTGLLKPKMSLQNAEDEYSCWHDRFAWLICNDFTTIAAIPFYLFVCVYDTSLIFTSPEITYAGIWERLLPLINYHYFCRIHDSCKEESKTWKTNDVTSVLQRLYSFASCSEF